MKIIKTLPWDKDWVIRNKTKYIIWHHAKSKKCTIADIEEWHAIDNGWSGGFGYHLFIAKDGTVYEGRPLNIRGAHCKGYNDVSIGICFEGDFENEHMTDIQFNSGVAATKDVQSKYSGTMIKGHDDFNGTLCPGKYFPLDEMREKVLNQHWAEGIYDYLTNDIGMTIHEKRFDMPITRAETFALLAQLAKKHF